MYIVKVSECGCSLEEKASWRREMVFGLDFIFQVIGAACAKALWFVRGTPNSSLWLGQKVVSGRDGWDGWLEIKPEKKAGARSVTG